MDEPENRADLDQGRGNSVRWGGVVNTLRFAGCAIVGWWAFAASGSIDKRIEPWSEVEIHYLAWMFVAGVAATLFRPLGFWWGLLGLYLSQAGFILMTYPLHRAINATAALTLLGMWPAILGVIVGVPCGLSTLKLPNQGFERSAESSPHS